MMSASKRLALRRRQGPHTLVLLCSSCQDSAKENDTKQHLWLRSGSGAELVTSTSIITEGSARPLTVVHTQAPSLRFKYSALSRVCIDFMCKFQSNTRGL
ncbi:hypothetical protein NDU88_001582 [Pleurodeles waltl]|uniref:Secreted protein n=1 Tax=Pleurodeles waltl TaxID=8319 RepID=A0AAV7R8E6_PLEWA|nr:hypothetical protein NDU88_001582 [Pleurodeles waltl]